MEDRNIGSNNIENSNGKDYIVKNGNIKNNNVKNGIGYDNICKEFRLKMEEEAAQLSISLSTDQIQKFYLYYQMLIEKNRVMNLTAITEMNQVISKHFIDSLSLVKAFPELSDGREWKILDLGTGAGFPGIPLKIAFPSLNITLLDSLNKRVRFLQEVIDALQLTGITGVHGRAEDLGRLQDYRESFDLCVSRAVANLSTLSEYCIPFVKQGGCFISYKSETIEEELSQAKKAIKTLGGKVEHVISFHLPGGDDGRSLVRIRKIHPTSLLYPRKAGLLGKEPLR